MAVTAGTALAIGGLASSFLGGKGDEEETVQRVQFPEFVQRAAPVVTNQLLATSGTRPNLSPTAQGLIGSILTQQAPPFALSPEAQSQLNRTLSGDFLTGPGFNEAIDAATRRILPQVTSTFAGAGRGRSGLAQVAAAQGIADSFASQFGAERNRQLQALPLAFSLANQPFQRELATRQQSLQALPFAFEEARLSQIPFQQRLGLLQALLGSPSGGVSTSTTTPGGLSRTGALFGAAGSLFGLGGPFGAGGAFGG